MLRQALPVVLISASTTRDDSSTPTPSGVARWARFAAAWNRCAEGWMPWVAATQAAMTGSRSLPCSVNALPENREP